MRDVWNTIRPVLSALLRFLRAAAIAVWSLIRVPVLFVLQVLAALVLIFEEWGWKPLSDALARLTHYRLWARLEQWIALLPPYGALAVFALPTLVLLPLKFFSVWLLANGFFLTAGTLFLAAKVASTAFIARIFLLTKPALMRIGWFASAYTWLMPWKDAIFARIRASFTWRYGRMLKNAVRLEVKQAYTRWRPWVVARWATAAPRFAGAIRSALQRLRVMWRIWRPRLSAEAIRWKDGARRAWEKLIGIA